MTSGEVWLEIRKAGDYRALGKEYGVSPVMARLLRNRGVENREEAEQFLEGGAESLFPGEQLLDCLLTAKILKEKIREKKRIRIIGDYDIDGVTSTCILWKGLTEAGADADHVIPHRVRDGYGLNEGLIRKAAEDGIDTILTCDNGIAAVHEIELARSLGLTVLVTDHHEVPFHLEGDRKSEDLPPADAVVDPHREGCPSPFKLICGAVVAWKLIQVLYREMGLPGSRADHFLEIAAFATIGDVMPLTGENRCLVREGLKRLCHTENPGLRALMDLNGLSGKELTAYHVGFILGPCLNAAGRLDTAETAFQLLISEDPEEARRLAVILKEMNESRKAMTERAVEEASRIAMSTDYVNDKVLVIFLPDCHESIAGIVAGKVRERFSRPVFVLTEGETAEGKRCFKGSGRSIEEYHMYEAMTEVKELFLKFGGHAMAAGLSMEDRKLPELRRRLNENCTLTDQDMAEKVRFDMVLPFSHVSPSLTRELSRLEPCGTGNPKPLFALSKVRFHSLRVLGKNKNVLKGTAVDENGAEISFIWFGDAEAMRRDLMERERAAVTYYPELNEFRGNVSLEIVIRNVK